ncbi:MAG: Fe-S cluster assembly ATPase SufC [Candidatus Aenigmarchaeota archaeon]|nr:Fe-S cluster assembly ATPase SufC [Candidatus Aenigmarchaeota archaeon]MDW8149414.1 Fe-S cluster assembly ATPase SufC [Candidatus Aenigmarchaeota archaeon]
MLKIENLHVSVENKEILKGVNLEIKKGEKVFILGPNGSGKTTLALSIMGHPMYRITKGKILFEEEDITNLNTSERAKRGMFLCMQNPIEVEGVSLMSLIYNSLKNVDYEKIEEIIEEIGLNKNFILRDLNVGLSGGEKKRLEILQLAIFKPKLAILDEFDSGLDVDSLKGVCKAINKLFDKKRSFLIITHYTRILKYIEPTKVKIMINGRIVAEGRKNLAKKIEKIGYKEFLLV